MAGGKAASPWVKLGKSGQKPFPGSYGGWVKMRRAPKYYPTTSQQKAIGEKGRRMAAECKGKSGSAFLECRHKALA